MQKAGRAIVIPHAHGVEAEMEAHMNEIHI